MINFFLNLKIFFDPFDRIPTSKTWCPAAGAQSEPARTTPTSLPAPNSVRGGEPAARPSGRPRPCSLLFSGAGPRSPPSFPRSLCDRKTQDFTYKHDFSMRGSTFTDGGMGVLICSSLSSLPKYCCMPWRYLLQRTSYIRVGYTLSPTLDGAARPLSCRVVFRLGGLARARPRLCVHYAHNFPSSFSSSCSTEYKCGHVAGTAGYGKIYPQSTHSFNPIEIIDRSYFEGPKDQELIALTTIRVQRSRQTLPDYGWIGEG